MPENSTLILGGAASGKSAFAENLVLDRGGQAVYVATALPHDGEMSRRIEKHRNRRDANWLTLEEPLNVASVLGKRKAGEAVLLDCATLWLSNHMLAKSAMESEIAKFVAAIVTSAASVVTVSNEVGHGVVPDNAMARQFREYQGVLNQALAAQSGLVVMVTAGLPLVLKGKLRP